LKLSFPSSIFFFILTADVLTTCFSQVSPSKKWPYSKLRVISQSWVIKFVCCMIRTGSQNKCFHWRLPRWHWIEDFGSYTHSAGLYSNSTCMREMRGSAVVAARITDCSLNIYTLQIYFWITTYIYIFFFGGWMRILDIWLRDKWELTVISC
jgi:hypothetical protein